MHLEREQQPFSTFSAVGVEPNTKSTMKLSGGKTIPYVYQISAQTTLPFIRLVGSSKGQKILSFAEKIIVPPNEMVTVENASYHPGDIWISSGWDPSVIPKRITVPVGQDATLNPGTGPLFPVDVRRAKRAFIGGLVAGPAAYSIFQLGQARVRSHAIDQAFSDLAAAQPRYSSTFVVPPATNPGLVPLGYQAQYNDPVHVLLDIASFISGQLALSNSGALYYVLEY